MAAGKFVASAPTIPEEQSESPNRNDDPKADDVAVKGDQQDAENAAAETDPKQVRQQQAVVTLIQGANIAQAKGGCWSIKQASILNNAIKQLTGNAEPSVLPVFDPAGAPAEGLPPQQRCVIYLIQAVGFGQAKGAYSLAEAAILADALEVLTSEDNNA